MIPHARCLVVALAFCIPLHGQQQATPEPQVPADQQTAAGPSQNLTTTLPQELVKLTARSDLVLVPVVVTDKSGKAVAGLKKDTFRVEENGKLRNLTLFEETKTEKPVAGKKDASSPTESNFLLGDDHVWRVTIVVLDMINTPSMRQLEAKKQLVDYLLRSASRDEPMAIFGLSGRGLRELHSFTTDTRVLVEALQKLKVSLSSEESTQPPAELSDDPYFSQQVSDEVQQMSDLLADLDATLSADIQRGATRETLLAFTQLARLSEYSRPQNAYLGHRGLPIYDR
jgi:VWFA-related protein